MFDWISKWLEKKVIEWIAGKIGISPDYLKGIIDEVIAFLKQIFDAFGSKAEATAFFKNVSNPTKPVSKALFREKLKELENL